MKAQRDSTERKDFMKRERVRGYGNTKRPVTFKDNIIVFGLCIACVAVIGITFYISNINRSSDEKTQVSRSNSENNLTEDYEDVTDPVIEDESEVYVPPADTTVEDNSKAVNEDEIYGTEPVVSADTKAVTFSAPLKGKLMKGQSATELMYSKTLEDWRIHNGTDIAAKIGTTVCAASDGVIEEAKKDIMYGYTIIIDHGNNIKSIYCNLTGTAMVQKGKTVERGEPIGMVGDSAICETSDEAHLHFEITVDGNYVNPLTYFEI